MLIGMVLIQASSITAHDYFGERKSIKALPPAGYSMPASRLVDLL